MPHSSRLLALLAQTGRLTPVHQPIVDLATGRPVAYEALARFGSGAPPDEVFDRARRLGLGHELEALAIDAALSTPGPPAGTRLTVNLSPSALLSDDVLARLPRDLSGITIEVTENELVTHDDAIVCRLAGLRRRGAVIAVDDAGAGYASLKQVMHLRPDVIKLDRSVITGVHEDPAKRALIDAFVSFGRQIGASVCAEGVEHIAEVRALGALDVACGQGYLFAAPAPDWPAISRLAAIACADGLARALRGADGTPTDEVTLEAVSGMLASCDAMDELGDCLAAMRDLLGVADLAVSTIVPGPGLATYAGPRWAHEPVYLLEDFPATAQALETGEALQVLTTDPRADADERALLAGHGYGALLLVPLVRRGRPIGTLEAFSRAERPWTRRQIRLARALGHQLALVLDELVVAEPPAPALRAAG
ncbi:MAG: EAL domain-containing protein [Solirubrobacterales bacterium]|nr:EAL domain-containing protein [Solirubrobacterales bacterium]